MNSGSIIENILSRTILKHIRRNQKNVLVGAKVGNDYARFSVESNRDVVTAIGFASYISENVNIADMAFLKGMNNLAMSGATPFGISVNIMLPVSLNPRRISKKTDRDLEGYIKTIMLTLNTLCNDNNLQIIGGHTEVSDYFTKPAVSITVYGQVDKDIFLDYKNVKVGYDIVLTNWCGAYGSSIIATEREDELASKFSKSYIETAKFKGMNYDVRKVAQIAISKGVQYMHDISCAGLNGALSQLATSLSKGIKINHEDISIKQETIEMCEFYNLNPYMLDGTGSVLLVTQNGTELVEELNKNNIEAKVIGKVTSDNDKVMVHGYENRYITPSNGDEIYNVFTKDIWSTKSY